MKMAMLVADPVLCHGEILWIFHRTLEKKLKHLFSKLPLPSSHLVSFPTQHKQQIARFDNIFRL